MDPLKKWIEPNRAANAQGSELVTANLLITLKGLALSLIYILLNRGRNYRYSGAIAVQNLPRDLLPSQSRG